MATHIERLTFKYYGKFYIVTDLTILTKCGII